MTCKNWYGPVAETAGDRFRLGEPMRLHTSFQIGGPADFWLSPASEEEILKAVTLAREAGVPVTFLGNGSNLLVSDLGIEGLVVQIGEAFAGISREGGRVTAAAGAPLHRVCAFARDAGLAGLEFAYGIPGNVGGAVVMNAGAYGGEVGQRILSVRVLDPSGDFLEVPGDEMDFSYRHSRVQDCGWIVLSAVFGLEEDDPGAVRARMEDFARRRSEKQPLNYPSAGSVFKRPEGFFAGKLIEDAGLKGFRIGGAQVSEKHAGFIVNRGGATASDVEALIEMIRREVRDRFGVELEPELRRIGRQG